MSTSGTDLWGIRRFIHMMTQPPQSTRVQLKGRMLVHDEKAWDRVLSEQASAPESAGRRPEVTPAGRRAQEPQRAADAALLDV